MARALPIAAVPLALLASWAALGRAPEARAQAPVRDPRAGGSRMGEVPEPPSPPSSAFPTVTPTVRFTDVAGKSSFAYTSNKTSPAARSFPQPMCGGIALIDYDHDGWKDIYSANGDVDYIGPNSAQHDTMFHNVDGKVFADVSEGLGPDFFPKGYQRGSAVGDLNGDGFPDLVVTSLNKRPRIHPNSGDNKNDRLWFDLVGKKSNRDALGAKVKLTTATGRTLYHHFSVSSGFMSSSDKRLHFGLRGESAVRSIEIRWPSGKTQTLENVGVDRLLRVEEPA